MVKVACDALGRLAALLDFARHEGIAAVGLGDIAELFTPAALSQPV